MSSRNSVITVIKPIPLTILISLAMSTTSAVADHSYGPVKPRDTLSKIINRHYTGSRASRKTIMKQIVANNPHAFTNGNMNFLKLNASLILPGNFWDKVSKSTETVKASTNSPSPNPSFVTTDSIDRSAPELTLEQMKGRIVFLDAERSSLIEQVAELKRETARLQKKVLRLESESQQSDEQLRILDAEIIRLTKLLKDGQQNNRTSTNALNQLTELQEKLKLAQAETNELRGELRATQDQLLNNSRSSQQTNQTIVQLSNENRRLQQKLQDIQPGVYYYNEDENNHSLSMLGKFQLPTGLIVVGSALLALILIALLATRKKKPAVVKQQAEGIDPFAEPHEYDALLETENSDDNRGFAQSHTQPEENVFKMFDEGSLEMDLKLDMAEAYLQVSDSNSARAILQEVIEGGSELQKRKATRLINRLAA